MLRNASVHENATDEAGATPGQVGVRNDGTLTGEYVTVARNGNTSIGGSGATTLVGSIVENEASFGVACTSPIASNGFNLASDATCGSPVPATWSTRRRATSISRCGTRSRRSASPAIDSIPVGTPQLCEPGGIAEDVRGAAAPQQNGCDRGAVEVIDKWAFVVDDPLDQHDTNPGDGHCVATGGGCTLRAAVDEVNALPDRGVPRPGSSSTRSCRSAGLRSSPNLGGSIDFVGRSATIRGGGHTITGTGQHQVIGAGLVLTIEGVTITGGSTSNGGGGVDANNVNLRDSAIVGNHSDHGAGGVSALNLNVVRNTVAGNTTIHGVGGLLGSKHPRCPGRAVHDNQSTTAASGLRSFVVTVTNSTVHHNVSSGGAAVQGFQVTIDASTVTANAGGPSIVSGQAPFPGSSIIRRSIVVADGGQSACIAASGSSLIQASITSDETCGLGSSIADPLLGAFVLHGGPTPSRVPAAGSPAVDATACGSAADQRGLPRPSGAACDIGAVERQPSDP